MSDPSFTIRNAIPSDWVRLLAAANDRDRELVVAGLERIALESAVATTRGKYPYVVQLTTEDRFVQLRQASHALDLLDLLRGPRS